MRNSIDKKHYTQLSITPLVRTAENSDLDAIRELYSQLSSDISGIDVDFFALIDDKNAHLLVAEENNKLLGMVICYIRHSFSSGKKMVIENLVVEKNLRNKGLGSALVNYCMDLAKELNVDSFELSCSNSKTNLHRFYEELGFKNRMRLYSLFPGIENSL